jgi:hypothetical protein
MSNWISVDGELPKDRTLVTANVREYKFSELEGPVTLFYEDVEGFATWSIFDPHSDDYDVELNREEVTHWMPLPEQPNGA